VTELDKGAKRRFNLELSLERLSQIDALKKEWGLRNRGDVLERLLETLFATDPTEAEAVQLDILGTADGHPEVSPGPGDPFDDQSALVLVGPGKEPEEPATEIILHPSRGRGTGRGDPGSGVEASAPGSLPDTNPIPGPPSHPSEARPGGIDLPGFVRRRSDELRRSLRVDGPAPVHHSVLPALPLGDQVIGEAQQAALQQWQDLYGHGANAAVLEAAMVWLAQDIWPQAEVCEGRRFTWSAACTLMGQLVPDWGASPPSFERVMVTAGVLEDPYSAATLPLRMPTLIHRFVHRFRRRRRGTSFQTLEHTMTLQGALKRLQLPTGPGHRLTLAQIREAYRDMALQHHPDSGGSLEEMRRVNEAYQLLKELYRQPEPPANPSHESH
jgi:hypothetical protein